MEIRSDNPEHGFQFPGDFEITAMGPAGSGLEDTIPALLEAADLQAAASSFRSSCCSVPSRASSTTSPMPCCATTPR